MAFIMGLDVGTTAVKCILVDDTLRVVAFHEVTYPTVMLDQGRVEQDPEDWWNAVVNVVRVVLGELCERAGRASLSEIAALSLSSQGGTLVLLDNSGRPVRRAICWLDQRARAQVKELTERLGCDFFYRRTGWRLTSGLPLGNLIWLREKEPESFERAARFTMTSDYIAYRLTGRYVIDSSSACISLLYNIAEQKWDEELLALAGIKKGNLSEIVRPAQIIGRLTPEASKELGLPTGIRVYAGGHDQFCVALGAGVIYPGEVLLSTGTAWVLLCVSDTLRFDMDGYLAVEEHVVPGLWGNLSSIPAAGASMRWLKTLVNEQDYMVMDREAEGVPPGSDGIFFFPHLAGAGAPHWEENSFGSSLGLRLEHTRGHMTRSLMEGVGYEVRWTLEGFERLGSKLRVLKMVGGGSKSLIWPKIIADITGMPLSIPDVSDAGALGAAILGGSGCGIFPTIEAAADLIGYRNQVQPYILNYYRYSSLFTIYRNTHDSLSKIYECIESASMRG